MKQSFLDIHGPKVGAALMALSSLVMIGVMTLAFVLVAPKWIEVQERLTSAFAQVEAQK